MSNVTRMTTLGKRIRDLREAADLTQTDLARRVCEIADQHDDAWFSQQRLAALENRKSNMTEADRLPYLAQALGVSLRWLCTGLGRADEPDWPFRMVRRERWDACNLEERGYIQQAMNRALDDIGGKPLPVENPGKRAVA